MYYWLIFSQLFRFDAFFDGSSRFIPLVTFYILVGYLVLKYIQKKRADWGFINIFFILGIYSTITGMLAIVYSNQDLNIMIRDYVSLLYFCTTIYFSWLFLKRQGLTSLNKILSNYIYLAIIFVVIETFIRFFYPELGINDHDITNMPPSFSSDAFYYFKYGSIMFYDSNYTGLYLLSIYIASLFRFGLSSFPSTIIFSLVILSLSRSAIISAIIVTFIYYSYNRRAFSISWLGAFITPIALWGTVENDLSLLTKFEIYSSTVNLISEVPFLQLFFGHGYSDGGFIFSPSDETYAHALIPLLLGSVGILGVIIYFAILIRFSIRGFVFFLYLIGFFVSGLSLADPFEPYFFIPMIITHFYLERKKRNVKSPNMLPE